MTATLLIVDDDPDAIRFLNEVLRGVGQLYFASCGEDAVRIAHERTPDIVLLDAEMPGMDGYEVCAALKADQATANASIIFTTAHSDIEHEMRALDLGAIDFISKPISPPIVRARVRNHIAMKAMTDELRRLAAIDPLTGLPNRRAFEQALEIEWRRARRAQRPMTAVMVDVDYFKNYNDHYGHPAGDTCLRAIADELRLCTRRPGDFVARYGGEEFMVVLPETDLQTAVLFGERLCNAVQTRGIRHERSPISAVVTVSVGVAVAVPEVDSNPEGLIDSTDRALYQAKLAGRNRVASIDAP